MDEDKIPISISGIDYTVNILFFERIDIDKEELIGETIFIKPKGFNMATISIHKNFYMKIKRHIKIKKIFE